MSKIVLNAFILCSLTNSLCAVSEKQNQRIDQYVQLVSRLVGRCHAPVHDVKILAFSVPSIIECYNDLVRSGNARVVAQLWRAYKGGAIRVADATFKYEFCHLLFIVLEHYAYHLLTGTLSKQEQNAADQISANIPIDELLNIIDLFYQRLMEFLAKTDQQKPGTQWHLPIAKRWVALAMVCVVIASKVYKKWFLLPSQPRPVSVANSLGSNISPAH